MKSCFVCKIGKSNIFPLSVQVLLAILPSVFGFFSMTLPFALRFACALALQSGYRSPPSVHELSYMHWKLWSSAYHLLDYEISWNTDLLCSRWFWGQKEPWSKGSCSESSTTRLECFSTLREPAASNNKVGEQRLHLTKQLLGVKFRLHFLCPPHLRPTALI